LAQGFVLARRRSRGKGEIEEKLRSEDLEENDRLSADRGRACRFMRTLCVKGEILDGPAA